MLFHGTHSNQVEGFVGRQSCPRKDPGWIIAVEIILNLI
jgi:hypothetical protein